MNRYIWVALIGLGLVAPLVVYPVFMMKLLCFALFASAFNLLLGYTGLLSFGHASGAPRTSPASSSRTAV
jgi:branched-chain amino acid transport system permease protein